MKNFFKSNKNQSILGGVLVILLCATIGYAVTIPNTFTAGTTAVAEDVNENFSALKTAVDALEEKVANLQNGALPVPSKFGMAGYAKIDGDNGLVISGSGFNSTGNPVTGTRNAVGDYTVNFQGMGDPTASGLIPSVQVTCANFFNICNIESAFTTGGGDFNVVIRTSDEDGISEDADVHVTVIW